MSSHMLYTQYNGVLIVKLIHKPDLQLLSSVYQILG